MTSYLVDTFSYDYFIILNQGSCNVPGRLTPIIFGHKYLDFQRELNLLYPYFKNWYGVGFIQFELINCAVSCPNNPLSCNHYLYAKHCN